MKIMKRFMANTLLVDRGLRARNVRQTLCGWNETGARDFRATHVGVMAQDYAGAHRQVPGDHRDFSGI
jgi:hypothetical protein